MTNRGLRSLGILILAATIFWFSPLAPRVTHAQDPPSNTQEQSSPLVEKMDEGDPASLPSPETVESEEEVARPGTLALSELEETIGSGRYIIKRGDTLWDISNRFLMDSFLWPRVWRDNQYILNPDLIYPGDILVFPKEGVPPPVEETPVVTPSDPEAAPPPVAEIPQPDEPEEAEEFVFEAARPKIKPVDLAAIGYIVRDHESVGVVIGARDNRKLIGENETAYLRVKRDYRPKVGDRLTVYRTVRKVYHPKTRKYMGRLIRILGVTEITGARADEKILSSKVLVSYDVILEGDSLIAEVKEEAPIEKAEAAAKTDPLDPRGYIEEPPIKEGEAEPVRSDLQGYIVEVKENRHAHAQRDVVYIDRGREDGIRVGDRFAVLRDGKRTSFFSPGRLARLPRRVIGQLKVLTVRDDTAAAQIIKGTEVIHKGDQIEILPTP